jgi:hypothetical protein
MDHRCQTIHPPVTRLLQSGIWFDQIGRAAGIAQQGPEPGASLGRSHAAENVAAKRL